MSLLSKLYKPSSVKTPHGRLATMFRKILNDLDAVKKVPSMIARHEQLIKSDKKRVSDTKIMLKDVTSDTMTFNNMLKMLQSLLKVKHIKITTELTYEDDTKSTHTDEFDLG